MYLSRLNDIPILRAVPDTIAPDRYNRVRLALVRLQNPLRIELSGLRSLDMILENDVWAIVDRDLNDIPVIAWTDFEHRSALHQPIHCTLRFYHAHGDIILDMALQMLDEILSERLAKT